MKLILKIIGVIFMAIGGLITVCFAIIVADNGFKRAIEFVKDSSKFGTHYKF